VLQSAIQQQKSVSDCNFEALLKLVPIFGSLFKKSMNVILITRHLIVNCEFEKAR